MMLDEMMSRLAWKVTLHQCVERRSSPTFRIVMKLRNSPYILLQSIRNFQDEVSQSIRQPVDQGR